MNTFQTIQINFSPYFVVPQARVCRNAWTRPSLAGGATARLNSNLIVYILSSLLWIFRPLRRLSLCASLFSSETREGKDCAILAPL